MQVVTGQVGAGEAGRLLQEHLTANLIRIGHSWHIQSRGIPQVPSLGQSLGLHRLHHRFPPPPPRPPPPRSGGWHGHELQEMAEAITLATNKAHQHFHGLPHNLPRCLSWRKTHCASP